MDRVTRIGVSLEPELLKTFDDVISKKGYVSRSEALRDLVRDSLAENDWKNEDMEMTGVLVIVFDSRTTDVLDKISAVCRKNRDVVVFTTNVDLNDFNKLQVIVSDGKLKDLKEFVNDMTAVKGVLRGKLTMVAPSTGNMHHIGLRE